jgi:hypothetical protein
VLWATNNRLGKARQGKARHLLTCAVAHCSLCAHTNLLSELLLLLLLQVKLVLERGTGRLPPWYFQGREGIATWEVRIKTSLM